MYQIGLRSCLGPCLSLWRRVESENPIKRSAQCLIFLTAVNSPLRILYCAKSLVYLSSPTVVQQPMTQITPNTQTTKTIKHLIISAQPKSYAYLNQSNSQIPSRSYDPRPHDPIGLYSHSHPSSSTVESICTPNLGFSN